MTGEIKIDVKETIGILTISRPEKLNSVTKEMLYSFYDKISNITNDPSITGVIITGEGPKSFSAGFDLETIKTIQGQEHTDFFKKLEQTMHCIRGSRNCITVAAINGYAVGFGAMVSSACDFRFFAENGIFRLPEVDLEVFPGSGAASNLLHLVGPAKAKDILMTGRSITAHEAFQIGIADRVYPHEELMPKTLEFLEGLAKKDQKLITRVKTLIDGMVGRSIEAATELESEYTDEWLRERNE